MLYPESLQAIKTGRSNLCDWLEKNYPDFKKFLDDTDVFLFPTYSEGFSIALLEAMSRGVPVIATNVGGISSIVKDEYSGLLIPSNDPCMLAYNILDLHYHPQKAIYLSQNGISKAKARHDKKSIKEELLNTYHNILQK